jgi:hypothetical protein
MWVDLRTGVLHASSRNFYSYLFFFNRVCVCADRVCPKYCIRTKRVMIVYALHLFACFVPHDQFPIFPQSEIGDSLAPLGDLLFARASHLLETGTGSANFWILLMTLFLFDGERVIISAATNVFKQAN